MIWDIIIIVLIAFAIYRGWRNGAVAMIVSFLIFIGAIIIATLFGTPFGKMLGLGASYLHPVIGFFFLFAIIVIIGGFVKRKLSPKQGMFAGLNSLLGAAMGLVRMILLLGLLFSFLRIFGLPPVDTIRESKGYPMVMNATALIVKQIKPLVDTFKASDVYEDMTPSDTTKPHPQH